VDQTRSKYVLLSLIVMLGVALRIYGLDKSLWLDEVLSVNRQRDIQDLISNIHFPGALYFIILHFFMLFGNDEVTARLPSVIFGILSILLIYKVGELFFGRPKEGLIGAFLLSISTMHIQYSQEARYYSLSMFLSLSSLFLFYKAIKENDKKLWVGFILSTILAVLSHWYMLFIPLIEMLFLAFILVKNRSSFIMNARKIGKEKIFLLVLGLMIISVFSLPLLQRALYLFETRAWIGVSKWGIQPASFFQDVFSCFSFGFRFSSLSYLYNGAIGVSFLYMFLLFFLLGSFTSVREHREQTILLLLWVFLPATIIFLLSFYLGSPVAVEKYLIFILPGYLIGVSRGISTIANSLLRCYYKIKYGFSSIPLLERKQVVISYAIAMVTMVAFAGAGVVPLQEYYKSPSEDWRSAAEYLEINSRSGDIIVVTPRYLAQCLLYYYEKNYDIADFMKNVTTSTGEQDLEDLKDICSKHDRVWFVMSPWHMEYMWKILDWVQHNFIEATRFTGVHIYRRQEGLIIISTKNMSFVGLDSPLDEPVACFWHNNDSATFNVNISKAANYTIVIHAKSWIKSALEVLIDHESKGTKTFFEHDWSSVELGTFYMDIGLHEIKIINREGGDLGDTNVIFDQVAIWPKQ